LCLGMDLGRRESGMRDLVPPESRRQFIKVKTVSDAGDIPSVMI